MKMKSTAFLVAALMSFGFVGTANAVAIFAPGDFIRGGAVNGANFEVGQEGFAPGVNNWPGFEGPAALIDGVGQKYLNFGGVIGATGALVTPGVGSSVVNSIKFWTANDAVERDPVAYELYGTNIVIATTSPGDTLALSDFNLIAGGVIGLPDTRNAGGASPLLDANSATLAFANTDAYTSYLLLLAKVKDPDVADSLQIAEAQLNGSLVSVPVNGNVPLPAAAWMFLTALGGLGIVGWRRRRATA